jgi:RimJ/RimL family protein N-acetyltransferase
VKHDLFESGTAFSLRPIGLQDAEFIVKIRTSPSLNKFIHTTSPSIDRQREWIAGYLARDREWMFMTVNNETNESEGTICIYNVDAARNRAEWGRWVLREGSWAALESAFLMYRVAFEKLSFGEMFCHTESRNLPVISFHSSCGLKWIGEVDGPNGEHWIEQVMTSEMWKSARTILQRRVNNAARLAQR